MTCGDLSRYFIGELAQKSRTAHQECLKYPIPCHLPGTNRAIHTTEKYDELLANVTMKKVTGYIDIPSVSGSEAESSGGYAWDFRPLSPERGRYVYIACKYDFQAWSFFFQCGYRPLEPIDLNFIESATNLHEIPIIHLLKNVKLSSRLP